MRSFTGRGRKGLLEHLQHIVKVRTDAQTMVDPASDAKPVKDRDFGSSSGKRPGRSDQYEKNPGIVNFAKAKRYEECRVCGGLETDGKTTGLYDNHSSNLVTGCPRFQAMTVDDRRDVCIRAKLCLKCTDPKMIHSQKHRFECKITKT